MNIEELAFKNYYELINIQKIDLLLIIEFLQKDRKQWINQFTQTHNESIDIRKENQELKKQFEEYKKLGFRHLQDKNNKLETQQKEFIKYLEDEIKRINSNNLTISELNLRLDDVKFTQYLIYKEILQKYKEIIGVSDENKTTI